MTDKGRRYVPISSFSNHIVTLNDRYSHRMALKALAGTNATLATISQRRISVARRAVRVCTNAVKFDYDTKVFQKELVKFADTEEYIYRSALRPVSHGISPRDAPTPPLRRGHRMEWMNGLMH